jgi:predicted ATPase
MSTLARITIENFKSIKKLDLDLKPVNILIGANGAGKSNFVGVFKFLNELVEGNLQTYTGRLGGANSILYFGRKQSQILSIQLSFDEKIEYDCILAPTVADSFVFHNETIYRPNTDTVEKTAMYIIQETDIWNQQFHSISNVTPIPNIFEHF